MTGEISILLFCLRLSISVVPRRVKAEARVILSLLSVDVAMASPGKRATQVSLRLTTAESK